MENNDLEILKKSKEINVFYDELLLLKKQNIDYNINISINNKKIDLLKNSIII